MRHTLELHESRDVDYFLDSASRSSGGGIGGISGGCGNGLSAGGIDGLDNDAKHLQRSDSRCFRYSPETTDYDSNCGDLDSLSGDFNIGNNSYPNNYSKYYASMPILEDGLSSGHASDTENNNPPPVPVTVASTGISLVMDMRQSDIIQRRAMNSNGGGGGCDDNGGTPDATLDRRYGGGDGLLTRNSGLNYKSDLITDEELRELNRSHIETRENVLNSPKNKIFKNIDPELDSLYSISKSTDFMHNLNALIFFTKKKTAQFSDMVQLTPPPPAPAPHRKPSIISCSSPDAQPVDMKNLADHRIEEKKSSVDGGASNNKTTPTLCSPIWIPR